MSNRQPQRLFPATHTPFCHRFAQTDRSRVCARYGNLKQTQQRREVGRQVGSAGQ
jgi:hypothetical protein